MLLPTTPFQTRLGTNYVPSEKEITQIKQIVSQVDTTATQIDNEMEALKAKQVAYSSFAAAHRALLSPLRRIPSDILVTIFSLCSEFNEQGSMMSSEAPLLFTRICHRWREVAIGTPSLWSRIHILIKPYPTVFDCRLLTTSCVSEEEQELLDVEDEAGASVALERETELWRIRMENKAHLAETWLGRGQLYPLTIYITAWGSTSGPGEKLVAKLLNVACEHVARWKHLYLFCASQIPSQILSLKASRTTQLRSFYMKRRADYLTPYQAMPPFPADGLTDTPTLRQLSFQDHPGAFVPTMPVQWKSLTEFVFCGIPAPPEFIGMSPSLALAILQGCSALVKCKLHLRPTSIMSGPQNRILLHHLQRLIVHEQNVGTSRMFFDSLDAPAIHSLALSCSEIVQTSGRHAIELSALPFLQRWGHRIRNFEIWRCTVTAVDLIQCVELTPNVEELTIDFGSVEPRYDPYNPPDWHYRSIFFQNDVLKKIEVGTEDGAPSMCPNLRAARITFRDCSGVAAKAIVRLVSSRRRDAQGARVPRLENFVVRFTTWTGGCKVNGKWVPPFRWQESKLNASLGEPTIRTEWPKVNGASQSPLPLASVPGNRASNPFQSWWDSESMHFSSYAPCPIP
ncbi:hypothetical protein BKA70DRAFT_1557168 [Coprinopsis sp. MPI-PUGE-AT-0042]|nr:hypothetical protein BKA70DRAFT_1557168 [Coprinopsis sp. MPI-PUGE-AT-0042]